MEDFIKSKLTSLGVEPKILKKYDEPHRYYHTMEHISYMVEKALEMHNLSDELFLAIVFHDIVYDPKRNDNEEESVKVLREYVTNRPIRFIEDVIMATKHHNKFEAKTELETYLIELDLHQLESGSFEEFMINENKIFKEYQWVDYETYKTERIKLLRSFNVTSSYVDYLKNKNK